MSINTIMVVDDDPMQLTKIKDIVSGEGYQIITAISGKDAFDKATANQPDLIFMDVVMPEMDGFATCRELKNGSATSDIPVVLVSSKDQEADKIWGQMQGCKAYITKPYTADQIVDQINKHS